MAQTQVFNNHANAYEEWFDNNPIFYEGEINVLKQLVGERTNGLPIGMGTGRFALPLGISHGVEPSEPMRDIAFSKGLHPVNGIAEKLPFENQMFDFALLITVICFVDEPLIALREAYRILKPEGSLIIGIIDKNTPLGKTYESEKYKSRFYVHAQFHSTSDIIKLAEQAGFSYCVTTPVKETSNAFVFIECFKL